MGSSRYEAILGFMIWLDRDIILYILPIDVLFSIAIVSVLSRGRRPLELFGLFIISMVVIFLVMSLLFVYGFRRPFFLFEAYSFP